MSSQEFCLDSHSQLRELIAGMRESYSRGENAMEFARNFLLSEENETISALIAYDLQAGTYIRNALSNPVGKSQWCVQISDLISMYLPSGGSLLEVGCGEATTLSGVIHNLNNLPSRALGFDISWSRCKFGNAWLENNKQCADLFVADLFHIPLKDESVDVVYTSHSLEPNGGREKAALAELLRVARHALILVEPIYELADAEARARMEHHGYVRNLKQTIENLGFHVSEYGLFRYTENSLNPSGYICINKSPRNLCDLLSWRCPLTHAKLERTSNAFLSMDTGIVYPILEKIPLLSQNHAIIASAYGKPLILQ